MYVDCSLFSDSRLTRGLVLSDASTREMTGIRGYKCEFAILRWCDDNCSDPSTPL